MYYFISHLSTTRLSLDLFKQDSLTCQMLMAKIANIFDLNVTAILVTRLSP